MVYSIQFLRHVAASLVVIYHGVIFLAPHMTAHAEAAQHLSKVGAAGVHIFFVISGFVMVWTQADQFGKAAPWGFFKRRVARIYPLYWILALINIPILILIERQTPGTIAEWIGAFLLWPSEASKLIFVGWTLTFEMLFYAVFALCLALQLGRVMTLVGMTGIFAALIAVGQVMPFDSVSLSFVTNVLLMEFVAGAWIAQLLIRCPTLPRWLGWGAVGLGTAGFALSAVIGYNALPSVIIWGLPSIFLVLGLPILEQRGVGARFFPRFATAGDASYALYLVHPVVMSPLAYMLPNDVMFGLGPMLAILLLTYGVLYRMSVAINQRVEKPLLRVTQRQTTRRPPAEGVRPSG